MSRAIVITSLLLFMNDMLSAELIAYWGFNQGQKLMFDVDEVSGRNIIWDKDDFQLCNSNAGILGIGMGNASMVNTSFSYSNKMAIANSEGLSLGRKDFTITGWIKSDPTEGQPWYHIYYESGIYNVSGILLALSRSDRATCGRLIFEVRGYNGNVSIWSDGRLDDSRWHWFAAVVKSCKLYLYIDGRLQSSSNQYMAQTSADVPNGYIIGIAHSWPGRGIDEVRIYNHAIEGVIDQSNGNVILSGELYENWHNAYSVDTCRELINSGNKLAADLNNDCTVDIADLAILSSVWLETSLR